MLGTPEFAVPTLRALDESRHDVVGVVSQPDRRRGRGRKRPPTAIRAEADARGLPLLQPEKVGEEAALAWMREREPDLGVVVAFGQFIPKPARELPELGMINGHASLLPRHRGAAPIQYAILAGDAKTGVSVMRVVKEMDAGDYCLQRETEIGPNETAGELEERLADIAAEALVEAIDAIAEDRAEFQPQDPALVTEAPKIAKPFGRLDWSRPRAEVLRRLRAATPWPGSNVALEGSDVRFRLIAARPLDGTPGRPGQVRNDSKTLQISALDGWVEVLTLQVPSRRATRTEDFLRGARLPAEMTVQVDGADGAGGESD